MEKKLIDLTPDKSIYEKIGHGQHTLEDALAELIDNSFDARTPDQINGKNSLNIEITIPLTKKIGSVNHAEYIEIIDNAMGMDEETAKNCLVIAKTTRSGKYHGRFGLGLKQSCLSIGKKFMISTKMKNSSKRYILNFDNEKFQKDSDWGNFEMIIETDNTDLNGTIIKIWDFWNPKLIYPNKITNLKNRFSWIFGPFIKQINNLKPPLELKINSDSVKEADLKSNCKEIHEIGEIKLTSKLPTGEEVSIRGWFGFLDKLGSTQGFSGFLLYRNLRLIRSWEHIGYKYHAETRLLVGELHLDDFPVTIDKKDFNRLSEQWIEIAGQTIIDEKGNPRLDDESPGLINKLLKRYISEERRKTESKRSVQRVQKEAIKAKEIESKKLAELEKIKTASKKGIELEVKKELIGQSINKAQSKLSKQKEEEEIETRLLFELKTFYDQGVIFVDNKEIVFSSFTENATLLNPLYRPMVKGDKIEVYINLDSIFFYELKHDFSTYIKLVTFMGLAESIIKIKKEEKNNFINYFNELLFYYSNEVEIIDSYDKSTHDLKKLNMVVSKLKSIKKVF